MTAIIGLEESGTIRDEFTKQGHDAISCDLKPSKTPGKHHQGDVMAFLRSVPDLHYDIGIFHPVCTRSCNSGVLRLYIDGKKVNGIDPVKWQQMIDGANFFAAIFELAKKKCKSVVLENPIPHKYAMAIIKTPYNQIIQPYNFGDDASKATCLWLHNVPLLQNTGYCEPRIVNGQKRWANQTDSGQNKEPPSANRAEIRSKTFPGVAAAMVAQWATPIEPITKPQLTLF